MKHYLAILVLILSMVLRAQAEPFNWESTFYEMALIVGIDQEKKTATIMLDPLQAPEKVVQAPLYHVPKELLDNYAAPVSTVMARRIQAGILNADERTVLIYGKIVKKLTDNSLLVDCIPQPFQKAFDKVLKNYGTRGLNGTRTDTVHVVLRADTKLVEGNFIMVLGARPGDIPLSKYTDGSQTYNSFKQVTTREH